MQQVAAQVANDNQAYFAQNNVDTAAEDARIAIAAGGSPGAQDASLTDKQQLPDPEAQLQSITVGATPLPPIDIVGAEGAQGFWGVEVLPNLVRSGA